MPQLAKGGKWVFGWVIVDADRRIRVPQDAWTEYGFQAGQEALLVKGSTTSGGFGLTTEDHIGDTLRSREFARTSFEHGRVVSIPPAAGIEPWQRLLAVRGSGRALGFIAHGPIFELALKHPAMPQSLP
jgi:hypothetical protein